MVTVGICQGLFRKVRAWVRYFRGEKGQRNVEKLQNIWKFEKGQLIVCDNRMQWIERISFICRALILKNCSCSVSLSPKVLKLVLYYFWMLFVLFMWVLYSPVCCPLNGRTEIFFCQWLIFAQLVMSVKCFVYMCRFELYHIESVIWRFREGLAKMTHFGKR